ncbi:MOSC domain-containing protein [Iamia sp. SCSIO 61187]|nr:MOSC domain-containing protein [Iamia sp. SCSIO 61187]
MISSRGPVRSAIAKRRVSDPEVRVGTLNIDGDRQADLSVHGGPDKAVYAYPVEHYAAWVAAGFRLAIGGVGENLAVGGFSEQDVRIGDVWEWGDAVLEVSQPRSPCFKLAIHAGRRGAGRHLVATGACGWYLRVLRTGSAPTEGTIRRAATHHAEPTVAEAFVAPRPGADPEVRSRVLSSARLADQWRAAVPDHRTGR